MIAESNSTRVVAREQQQQQPLVVYVVAVWPLYTTTPPSPFGLRRADVLLSTLVSSRENEKDIETGFFRLYVFLVKL